MRLTPSQNLLLVDVKPVDRDAITKILADHGVPVENQGSVLRRASMACPSMPTCGLGLAESERALPDILGRIEESLREAGLPDEEIVIRMTGCPNGCARSVISEIGLVGRAPGKYQLLLGGNISGTRLNRIYKESVKAEEIAAELKPLFVRYKSNRQPGERFGDFCVRSVLPAAAPASTPAPANG